MLVVAHSCVLSWWQAVYHAVRSGGLGTLRQPRGRRVGCGRPGGRSVARQCSIALSKSTTVLMTAQDRGDLNGRDSRGMVKPDKRPSVIVSAVSGTKRRTSTPWTASPPGSTGRCRSPAHRNGLMAARAAEEPPCLGVVPSDELVRLYGDASIFALPARYEPFGLSILEAALSGCALVLGDIPSLRELWAGAAVFVPPDDHKALSA